MGIFGVLIAVMRGIMGRNSQPKWQMLGFFVSVRSLKVFLSGKIILFYVEKFLEWASLGLDISDVLFPGVEFCKYHLLYWRFCLCIRLDMGRPARDISQSCNAVFPKGRNKLFKLILRFGFYIVFNVNYGQ